MVKLMLLINTAYFLGLSRSGQRNAVFHDERHMVGALADTVRTAMRCWAKTLQHACFVRESCFDEQFVVVGTRLALEFVFPVGNGREQRFLQPSGSLALGEAQDRKGVINLLATYVVYTNRILRADIGTFLSLATASIVMHCLPRLAERY